MSAIDNTTPPRIPIGTDDFQKLVLEGDIFVDKSLLLKDILEGGSDVLLITRPRRWGKSLNLNMIHRFLEIEMDRGGNEISEEQRINSKIFLGGEVALNAHKTKRLKPLKIAKHQELIDNYQGQYPVIRISLKEINGSSVDKVQNQLKKKIQGLFLAYEYLQNSSSISDAKKAILHSYMYGEFASEDLETSLNFLSGLLHQHFGKKVFILIDEYDAPINSAYLEFGRESEEYKEVIKLFRNFFGSSLKTNENLAKGVITGILRIAKANLLSDLNNLTENSLFDEYLSKSYGFTQEEVDELLTLVPVKTDPEEIKSWYNGYTFGGQIIYNPWSIMRCLANNGKLEHYWLDSGGTGIIDHALTSDKVQQDLQDLIQRKTILSEITKYISFDTINTRSGLYSLLLLSGYLNQKVFDLENDAYELSIPNREVRYIYLNRVIDWLKRNIEIDKVKYIIFTLLLEQGKLEEFTQELKKILLTCSFHQTGEANAETFYNGFMVAAFSFLSDKYIIEHEPESGKGRADTILISKERKGGTNAIIVEYKICKKDEDLIKTAKEGLKQINDRNYVAKIKQHSHVKQIIKISIAFCGKDVETAYEHA